MIERDEPYTPSVDEIVMGKTHMGDNFWRDLTEDEVRRGVEAVRQEEREKAAHIAEGYSMRTRGKDVWGFGAVAKIAADVIATGIRAQGKEQ